ncbi:MAG: phage tail sheath family protein [Hormoscilla sp. GM7CHS1pb]|nr:phage tail sheath family protein [Hormoscilla sp. GM7CHS1pb]
MAIEIYALNEAAEGYSYGEEVGKIIAELNLVATKAALSVGTDNKLVLEAANGGSWGNELRARVDYNGITDDKSFNLSIKDGGTGVVETFLNVSVDPKATRYVEKVLEKDSKLVRVFEGPQSRPEENDSEWAQIEAALKTEVTSRVTEEMKRENSSLDDNFENWSQEKKGERQKKIEKGIADIGLAAEKRKFKAEGVWYKHCSNGVDVYKAGDGVALKSTDFTEGESEKKGIYALENADLFNLLCIPPYKDDGNIDTGVIDDAIAYCEKRRAMMIIDAPSGWNSKGEAKTGIETEVGSTSMNAAIFFPRLKMPNPLKDNQMEDFAACGAVAGVMARTDATRGVWKAPAGLDAVLRGVAALSVPLTDAENGELNPLGINCLRNKPPAGKIMWGSRTRVGNDMLASEWKYIPVRRLALYLEETLYRNTKWAVFEPNDEPLWAQLRLSIGSFMDNLFRQGAFQGCSPKDAYFVKCDKETTTQYDIDRGIVNIEIGFAPLKPAEFVILKFQQIAGQS